MSAPTLHTPRRGSWSGPMLSEFRKTLSTSAWWALLVPAGLGSLALGWAELPAPSVYYSLNLALLFAILFGVVCVSAEYRHRTIATSYLVVADRSRFMASKVVLAAAVGAGYALVATAMVIAGQLVSGFPFGAELPSMLGAGAGAGLVLASGAVLGVGLGALIGKQLLAVLASVLYLIVVEPMIVLLVDRPGITTYLPGMSADTALGGLTGGAQFGGGFGVAQPWWVMLLVFAGWAAVAGLAGTLAAQRRDIG
jgi:ABC-2 type transport system permease protein